jgi:hypothetical protein
MTTIAIGLRRRDGKYPVTFAYPISGRRLSKVLDLMALLEAVRQYGTDAQKAEWQGIRDIHARAAARAAEGSFLESMGGDL